jgi:hypothetical protein
MRLVLDCFSSKVTDKKSEDGRNYQTVELDGISFKQIIKQAKENFGPNFFLDNENLEAIEEYYHFLKIKELERRKETRKLQRVMRRKSKVK